MINVKNDWTWVNNHVDEEMENETLFDGVHAYMQKHNIDLDGVKELYHDGLLNGIEDGKYLPFSQWFYEFSEEW